MTSISLQSAVNAYNRAGNLYQNERLGSASPQSNNNVGNDVFSGIVKDSVGNVADTLRQAESVATQSLVKQADITDVVTAISDAELTLQTMVSIRDRMVSSLQEIMRMPI